MIRMATMVACLGTMGLSGGMVACSGASTGDEAGQDKQEVVTQGSEEQAEGASAEQASALATRTSFYASCSGTKRWGPTDGRPIEWANAASCKKYNGYYGGYTALPSSESPCYGDVANINGELHCR